MGARRDVTAMDEQGDATMSYPSCHGGGGYAISHSPKVIQMADYEHLRPRPYTYFQFWIDCMFWWLPR
jgi:hypothetical protein